MKRSALIWSGSGAAGAIGLAVLLIPFRSLTSACSLAFAFIILTIVVAEAGGRGPGLVTAAMSALSLNFFLTRPYLTLRIDAAEDIVAFVGLGVSGLVAAAFGRRRHESSAAARRSNRELDALRGLVANLEAGVSLATALESLRRSFGLQRMVVRDLKGRIVAASPAGDGTPARTELDPETLEAGPGARPVWGGSRHPSSRRGRVGQAARQG